MIAPILLLFVFLQRYFIQGVATTWLKVSPRRLRLEKENHDPHVPHRARDGTRFRDSTATR